MRHIGDMSRDFEPRLRPQADRGPDACPICGRPLIQGPSVDVHHWVPRSRGGRLADPVHKICHRMIHRLFDEAALATAYDTPERLRAHPEMQRFLAWVRRKPADYVDWPKQPRARRR